MTEKTSTWSDFNKVENPPRPRLVGTLNHFSKEPGIALDLGCGSGRDTRELLNRGWAVTAVDSDSASLDLLRTYLGESEKLNVINADFESLNIDPSSYDLINASYALPFCKPQSFLEFWNKIINSLKPNGVATFELFGINDEWAQLPKNVGRMSFHSRAQVEDLFKSLKVEALKENEFKAPTFDSPEKHWHLFMCIVRKPS